MGSDPHDQGNDHRDQRPRDPRGHPRGRPARRGLRRARTQSRRGRQRLQGPGLQGAAWHAVGVCRSRPRARRVPLRLRRRQHDGGVRAVERRRRGRRGTGGGRRRRRGQRRRRSGGRAGRQWRRAPRPRRTRPRSRRPRQGPGAQDRGAGQGRAGHHRAGGQGAARHQGRAPHLARHDARPLPGLHAHRRPRRRVAQDLDARGAQPAARHRQGVPRPAPVRRRRDHPHRRREPAEGRHRLRPPVLPPRLDRDAAEVGVEPGAGGRLPRGQPGGQAPARPADRRLHGHPHRRHARARRASSSCSTGSCPGCPPG